jgi:hypothetical protein
MPGSWSAPRASLAAEEHMSWGISLARVAQRKTLPNDVRSSFALSPDAWLGLFLNGSPENAIAFWERDRVPFWDWARSQSFSFVQSLATPALSRAFTIYDEIIDAGMESGIDWPVHATPGEDQRIAKFIRDREVPAIVISRGVTFGLSKYQKRRMKRMKEIAGLLERPMTIFILGPSHPRVATMTAAFFKGHDIFIGNTKAWVQAGRWSIQPYQDVNKDKWSQAEVYRESVRRWRKWSKSIAESRRGAAGA